MEYATLVEVYKELEETSGNLDKRAILRDLFSETDGELLPTVLRLIRGKVFASWKSENLGISSSLASRAIAKATGISDEQIEDWWREEGDLGDAAALAVQQQPQQTLVSQPLEVERVHETLKEIATYDGEGSQARRIDSIAGLLSDADPDEARYIIRTVVGAMRLGVGEGLIRDALADAFLDGTDEAIEVIQRGYEVTNDFAIVAKKARSEGRVGLENLDVEVFRPIKPMLAQKADSIESALSELGDKEGNVLLESKYDGIRAKLHRDGDDIKIFTRRLEDVSRQFPDVIEAVDQGVNATQYILEAEVVGYDPETGDPVPFQELSQRIKRKYEIEELAEKIPVTVYLFDLLYLDGESYLDEPLRQRLRSLEKILNPVDQRLERASNTRTDSIESAEDFYTQTMAEGHEGMMIKNLEAAYQPGSRVGYQLKVKPTMEPLDLVVTRAKWSEGRKSEFLGRPYLACQTEEGEFREIGRMHTGFTDEDLEELTELLEPLIQTIEGREAKLEPKIVLEVEYEEIQKSPKYGSGYALRFPRFKQIRRDLAPSDIDTLEFIKELYQDQD